MSWWDSLESLDVTGCPIACVNLPDPSVTLTTGNNIYTCYLSEGETSYNLNFIQGLTATYMSEVIGATLDPTTGTLTNISEDGVVQYIYDCGNGSGILRQFTIHFQ